MSLRDEIPKWCSSWRVELGDFSKVPGFWRPKRAPGDLVGYFSTPSPKTFRTDQQKKHVSFSGQSCISFLLLPWCRRARSLAPASGGMKKIFL